MQANQPQPQQIQPTRVYQNLQSIKHFSYDIPLPEKTEIYQYLSKFSDPAKKSKLKHKFNRFTYYKDQKTNQIIKILFINDNNYIDQGKYPFTQPLGNVGNFNELHVKRLKTTEAAYIGHVNQDVVIKKLQGVKLGQNGTEFQTVDEKFQTLKIGNQKRFHQFLKLMSSNKNSIGMSIRVIISQSNDKTPQVIDYEFFHREQQLIKKNQIQHQSSTQNQPQK